MSLVALNNKLKDGQAFTLWAYGYELRSYGIIDPNFYYMGQPYAAFFTISEKYVVLSIGDMSKIYKAFAYVREDFRKN